MIFNKYSKLYFGIILKAQSENRDKTQGYFEEHHGLPKSIYPEYRNLKEHPWNRVLLTAKEHYLCHWLLIRCFDFTVHIRKMEWAFHKLAFSRNRMQKLTSAEYELARKVHSKNMQRIHPSHSNTQWSVAVSAANKKAWQNEERRKITSERMKRTWEEKREYMTARARENSKKGTAAMVEKYRLRKESQ